ncbi:MAG: cyclophilin-like fold protein [Nitrososphaeraceae archaeon]
MKEKISIKFTDSDKTAYIELDDSQSPKTVKAILDNLPIKVKINRWGDELYTDKTPIVAEEENAQPVVKPLDVAYWPEGNALCLFYGSTPISKSPDEILPYSPVNIVGKIITKDDILEEFKDHSTVVIKSE